MKFFLLASLVFLSGNSASSNKDCKMCLHKALSCLDLENCFGEMMVLQNEFGITHDEKKPSDQAIRANEEIAAKPHAHEDNKLHMCENNLSKSQLKIEHMDKMLTEARKQSIHLEQEFFTCHHQLDKLQKLLEEANYFVNVTHQLSHLSLNAHDMISNVSKKASSTMKTPEEAIKNNLSPNNGSIMAAPLDAQEVNVWLLIIVLTTTCGISVCCHAVQLVMWVRLNNTRRREENRSSGKEDSASEDAVEDDNNDKVAETNV